MATPAFFWNRLEPSPSRDGVSDTLDLAAEIRDPAWMLCRQWQMGEFNGDDGGSLAYAEVSYRQGEFTSLTLRGESISLGGESPSEKLCIGEPFEPDTMIRIELARRFEEELAKSFGEVLASPDQAIAWFRTTYPLGTPTTGDADTDAFNPLDATSQELLNLAVGTLGDGYEAYQLAKKGTFDPGKEPEQDQETIAQALTNLLGWANEVFGQIDASAADPAAWVPRTLGFDIQASFEVDGQAGQLTVQPDAEGALDWGSFDVITEPEASTSEPTKEIVIPAHVRFPGMPSPRYWDFEEGDCSALHIDAEERDVGVKLLVLDFVLNGCEDWYSFPLSIDVGSGKGKVVKVESIVAHDVFGQSTSIASASADAKAGVNRWTMFSLTKPTADPMAPAISDLLVIPPSAGAALLRRVPIEEVKFVRDDFANLVWGIERTTPTALGTGRLGAERDAALDETMPWPGSASTDTTSPLRYELQSRIPSYWIPLLGVSEAVDTSTSKKALEAGSMLRPVKVTNDQGEEQIVPIPVLPVGRILRPADNPYRINPEEVLRTGTTVQRLVYRARWVDGSCHVWMGRSRLAGAGEGNSELRFDSAISTK